MAGFIIFNRKIELEGSKYIYRTEKIK